MSRGGSSPGSSGLRGCMCSGEKELAGCSQLMMDVLGVVDLGGAVLTFEAREVLEGSFNQLEYFGLFVAGGECMQVWEGWWWYL